MKGNYPNLISPFNQVPDLSQLYVTSDCFIWRYIKQGNNQPSFSGGEGWKGLFQDSQTMCSTHPLEIAPPTHTHTISELQGRQVYLDLQLNTEQSTFNRASITTITTLQQSDESEQFPKYKVFRWSHWLIIVLTLQSSSWSMKLPFNFNFNLLTSRWIWH